ncbi:hypothetical protein LSM04_008915 [Trypanosoma melophagium]|uniref:uncharacterized protein n=1 Tax=Trypanosoma melophagium TaxID=715481 RepID=UPI00351A39CD|nr:hypothetical protein LSM04_008915 [Trypanosoma melophagium]
MQGMGYANEAPYVAGAPYQGAAPQQPLGSQYGIQGYDNVNNYDGNPYYTEGANNLIGNPFRQNEYPYGNNNGPNPAMGNGMGGYFGSYGGYGMNSMGGFDSMSQASMYRLNESPPVIYKLFSSRRDRFGLSSQRDFHTRHSRLSLYGFGRYGSSMRNSMMGSAFERDMPSVGKDTGFVKYDEPKKTEGRGFSTIKSPVQNANEASQTWGSVAPTSNNRQAANRRSLSPTSYAFDVFGPANGDPNTTKRSSIGFGGHREVAPRTQVPPRPMSVDKGTQSEKLSKREKVTPSEKLPERQRAAQPEKPQEREKAVPRHKAPEKEQPKRSVQKEKPAPAIPLSREMSVVEHQPPRISSAFGDDGGDPALNQSQNEDASPSRIRSRSLRGSMRRRSSLARTRSISAVNMSIAEFPEGDEVKDILAAGIVGTRRASSVLADPNPGENRRRSSVALKSAGERQPPKEGEENSQEQQRQPEEHRSIDGMARRQSEDARRQQQEQEQNEREERKKFDKEMKRKNEEERNRRKSEERKRFEEAKELEQKQEEERIKKLITQPEVTPKAPEGRRSKVRRSSRVRPSRANSMLGAIPEQPPDVEAGSVRDLLDGSLASARASVLDTSHPRRSIAHPGDGHSNLQEEKERQRLEEQKRRQQEEERKRREEERRQQQEQEQQQQQQQQREDQSQKEEQRQQQDDQQKDPRKSNPIKTVVLVEKHPKPSDILTTEGNSFTYRGVKHDATEVILRDPKSMSYHSKTFNSIKDFVCDGYNSSIVSVEAPNAGKVFHSPVWTGLTRIVRGVLQKSTNTSEHRTELAAAFGFIHKDKVRDLIVENSTFEQLMIHPSPIYGPRIPQLRYNPIASPSAFEEMMSTALHRATADPILSSMNGVAVALLLSKQYCLITNEAGEKTYDVLLSSLVVASTGSDTLPYDSALARVRNEYSMLFHLLLGGPCFTCFMLNLSMSEEEASTQEDMEKLVALHDKMKAAYNYPLRNGSVLRFVNYVETANREGKERVKTEENPEKRSKLERYVQEQTRLLNDAGKMLEEAREAMRGMSSV